MKLTVEEKLELEEKLQGLIDAIKEGDSAKVEKLFDSCNINMGFVLNEEEDHQVPGSFDTESMLDWNLINVAAAHS